MNVLIIGKGARESAFIWSIRRTSPKVDRIFIAPGSPGMMYVAEIVPIDCSSLSDIKDLVQFAKEYDIGLTIVGPEQPLSLGIVNEFQKAGIRIFGPSKEAAEIESSKIFAKKLMQDIRVPTASFREFSDYREVLCYINGIKFPSVIKVDGLAKGKGVYVCKTLTDGKRALKSIMVDKIHGDAGESVIIEDFLEGEEVSMHLLCDGENVSFLPSVRDYKKLLDGDKGPNTGGMGAYNLIEMPNEQEIYYTIVDPVLEELKRRGRKFTGCFYPGIIITQNGPKILEFNCRFGSPEAEIILPLLEDDIINTLNDSIDGKLDRVDVYTNYVVCVNLVSKGYPGVCDIGHQITGFEAASKIPGVFIFPGGVGYKDNKLVNIEGRVLSIVGVGNTRKQARERAYKAVELIHFEGMHYRTDIAKEGT